MATPAIAATAATVTGAVNAVAPGLVNNAIQHLKYPFEVDGNMKALQVATRGLVAKRDDVKIKIEIEERQGGRVKNEVSGWMKEVETIEKDVGVLEQKYQSRRQCLGGFHFNCWSNYSISKGAAEMLLDVKELRSKGATYETAVTMSAPPPPVQEVPIEPTSFPISTADYNLNQALNSINNEPAGIIGLLGMGGVGKTHLLERINNSYIEDSSFGVVVIVTASKECSIAKIQSSLAERLKLAKNPNEEQQASIIFNFLHVRNFLLLLDDLWEGLDLIKVGVPPLGLGEQYKRKVVLTTRSSQVCGQMGVRKEIKVGCLNKEESWSLFREKVGSETLNSHPLIPYLARKVIDELGGLPLALITIGRTMYGKRDTKHWEYAIGQLQSPGSAEDKILGSEEGVYQQLKFSYENLENTRLKKCFLSCSLWPEDCSIQKGDLIKIWIGLGYIQESNIQKAYNLGHVIIGILLEQCLLEKTHEHGETEILVKMHDVMRDMAHWIACDFRASKNRWVIQAGLFLKNVPNRKELWYEAEFISFRNNNIKELSFDLSSPSNLTSLMLGSNQLSDVSFFRNFSCLTRLHFLDLSNNQLIDFPLDICKLLNLQYLDLSNNGIRSIPTNLKYLINLKFFYLVGHAIKNLPEGVISELKSLEVLGLQTFCEIMPYNPSFFEELKCLDNLKALNIKVCNLSDLEKVNMLSLTVQIRFLQLFQLGGLRSFSLSMEVHRGLVGLTIWNNNDLENFVVERNQFPNLEWVHFVKVTNLIEIMSRGVLPIDVFPKLRKIIIERCSLEHITCILHLPSLQEVRLSFCNNMKELVTRGNHDQDKNTSTKQPTFPSLEVIVLYFMEKLERVCDSNYHFPSLRFLYIRGCPNVKKLPFPNGIPHTVEIDTDLEFE